MNYTWSVRPPVLSMPAGTGVVSKRAHVKESEMPKQAVFHDRPELHDPVMNLIPLIERPATPFDDYLKVADTAWAKTQ